MSSCQYVYAYCKWCQLLYDSQPGSTPMCATHIPKNIRTPPQNSRSGLQISAARVPTTQHYCRLYYYYIVKTQIYTYLFIHSMTDAAGGEQSGWILYLLCKLSLVDIVHVFFKLLYERSDDAELNWLVIVLGQLSSLPNCPQQLSQQPLRGPLQYSRHSEHMFSLSCSRVSVTVGKLPLCASFRK